MVDLNKKLQMCMLADFYGNLLTEKQQQIMSSYWEQDNSLSEIASELGITRQAVHDTLTKAENLLIGTEEKCGFMQKYLENKRDLLELLNLLDESDSKQNLIAKKIKQLISKL